MIFKTVLGIKRIYHCFTQEILYFAASLSFYTIFAILPIFSFSIYILSFLPIFDTYIQDLKVSLLSYIIPSDIELFIHVFNNFMKYTHRMGLMGIVYIFLTSILFFRNFEFVTSKMLSSKPRIFLHSLAVYLILMVCIPLSIGFFLYFKGVISGFLEDREYLFFNKISSYLLVYALFLLLFILAIKEKVNKGRIYFSVLLSGSVWLGFKEVLFSYIKLNKTYVNLYSSISMLLAMMLWLYVSWIIILLGIKICQKK